MLLKFLSEEFQVWCRERRIIHLMGASYHPATNGATECLVQTFKQSMRKTSLPPQAALQDSYCSTKVHLLIQPNHIVNCSKVDRFRAIWMLCSLHQLRLLRGNKQGKLLSHKFRRTDQSDPPLLSRSTVLHGPRCNQILRWVPTVVTKILGTRTVNVHVYPREPTWKRHLSKLRPRHGVEDDADQGEVPHLTGNQPPRDPPVERKDTAASVPGTLS